jgi:small subunit ribosomal protein S3e
VADGVLYAEVNELLNRELADAGYAGVEIRNAPMKTEIIIRAAEPLKVAGEKARRIRELTSVVQKRFKFAEGAVELFAERVANKGLSAQAQVRGQGQRHGGAGLPGAGPGGPQHQKIQGDSPRHI